MNHLAIPVSDQERSRGFYETYFGFGGRPSRRYDDGVLMLYDANGSALALGPIEPEQPAPSWMHFGVRLASRDAVLALRNRLALDGVELVEESDDPDYVSVKCRDPDGYIVEGFWETNPEDGRGSARGQPLERAAQMNAEGTIWDALRGALVTRALGLAADLRIARALAAGPRSLDELAGESGADVDTLYRVLRALASDGIFEEIEPGVFRNTAASEVLASDGWDDFAHLFGGAWLEAVASLDVSGEPSFPAVHEREFWVWLAAHPDERAAFDRAMAQGWKRRLERLEGVDWRGDELVVDVGGGDGSLLLALLDRHPGMRGIVFDLPETVRDENALGDRCQFVEGNFFESVPAGNVHLLCTILHDWDDDAARRILETVRAAGSERLIILDSVIEPGNAPDGAKWLDLLMLVLAGGRERSEEQWRTLLDSSGWHPTRIGQGPIEARRD
jgi:catechol 2,3-dioxygenase-like lactoylglutathione lyase family enzyme